MAHVPPDAAANVHFYGVTTGTYEVSVSYNSGTANTCILLYYPGIIKVQAFNFFRLNGRAKPKPPQI